MRIISKHTHIHTHTCSNLALVERMMYMRHSDFVNGSDEVLVLSIKTPNLWCCLQDSSLFSMFSSRGNSDHDYSDWTESGMVTVKKKCFPDVLQIISLTHCALSFTYTHACAHTHTYPHVYTNGMHQKAHTHSEGVSANT